MNNEYAATAYAERMGSQEASRWVTQTKFYDPTQPQEVCTGNCTEAALASLFGIGLDDVPSLQGLAGSDYWDALEEFVRSRGYALSMHPPSRYPAGLYLADGPSERGCGHFVVMRDGKMVHDPHPSRAGLLNVERVWSLMALDPAALSAQPSPGGQGDAWDIAELVRTDLDRQSCPDAYMRIAMESVVNHLTARQPVGEPVFRERSTHKVYRGSCGNLPCHCWADTDHIAGDEVKRYATPPAQAVDLGQFRALAEFGEEFAFSAEKQPQSRVVYAQARRLQALIDSQAVGNK